MISYPPHSSQMVCCRVSVQRCVQLVSRAKKPVILLGSQATLPPTPVDELRAALEVSPDPVMDLLDCPQSQPQCICFCHVSYPRCRRFFASFNFWRFSDSCCSQPRKVCCVDWCHPFFHRVLRKCIHPVKIVALVQVMKS